MLNGTIAFIATQNNHDNKAILKMDLNVLAYLIRCTLTKTNSNSGMYFLTGVII